jgi:ribosome-binding protein aMBF1 (putative translation factor)
MKVSEKVLAELKERGWTKEMLADKVDIPADYFHMMARGKFEPSEMEIELIEKAFGWKPGTLVED